MARYCITRTSPMLVSIVYDDAESAEEAIARAIEIWVEDVRNFEAYTARLLPEDDAE